MITGTAPTPIRLPLSRAERLAAKILGELQGFCSPLADGQPGIAIAGSIRRRRPEVADLDFVCLPQSEEHRLQIRARTLKTNSWIIADGPRNLLVILDTPAGPIQVDIFFAAHAERHLFGQSPCNWGSLLLCRTGSKEHNIWFASACQRRGYKWNPYAGIFSERGGACIASETEEQLYAAVEQPWIKPEDRER